MKGRLIEAVFQARAAWAERSILMNSIHQGYDKSGEEMEEKQLLVNDRTVKEMQVGGREGEKSGEKQ